MPLSSDEIRKMAQKSVHVWLVKSGGRVMGPFSKEDVEEKIRTREIVALDEITLPLGLGAGPTQGRWRYVREEEAFSEVLKQVGTQFSQTEHTQTSTVSSKTVIRELNDDHTATIDLDERFIDEDTPSDDDVTPTDVPQKEKTIVGRELDRSIRESSAYTYKDDRNFKRQIKTFSVVIWIAILGVIAAIYFKLQKQAPQKGPLNSVSLRYETFLNEGQRNYKVGEFELAESWFLKAHALKKDQVPLLLKLSSVVLYNKGDTVSVKRWLEPLAGDSRYQPYQQEIYNLLGVAGLIDKKYQLAKEYLQKSLQLGNEFIPALLNQQILAWLEKDRKGVQDLYKLIRGLGQVNGQSALLQIHSLLQEEGNAEQVLEVIEHQLNHSTDFRQEVLLAKYFLSNRDASEVAEKSSPLASHFLNRDPYLSEDHRRDPRVYMKALGWTELLQWCEAIHTKSNQRAAADAVLGYCHLKAGDLLKGEFYISQALKKKPSDELITALKGYQLIVSGDRQKALGILNHSLAGRPTRLSLSLLARHCERPSRRDCAKAFWQQLLRENENDLSAIGGIALLAAESEDSEVMRAALKKGLRFSRNYKPLLKAQDYSESPQKDVFE